MGIGRSMELPCVLWALQALSTVKGSPAWKLAEPIVYGFLWRFHHISEIDEIVDG